MGVTFKPIEDKNKERDCIQKALLKVRREVEKLGGPNAFPNSAVLSPLEQETISELRESLYFLVTSLNLRLKRGT